MQKIDVFLILGLIVIVIVGIFLIAIPMNYPLLNVKTVTKVSGIYKNPIYLVFHWVGHDEIQVGKQLNLDLQIRGLPYNQNMTLRNIELHFNESQLNYWSYEGDSEHNEISTKDYLTLTPDWSDNIFYSDTIPVRFVVPDDIIAKLCDYNISPPCRDIPTIIHPAPYDLANRIDTNRIQLALSLVTAALSSIVVWHRLRENKNSK